MFVSFIYLGPHTGKHWGYLQSGKRLASGLTSGYHEKCRMLFFTPSTQRCNKHPPTLNPPAPSTPTSLTNLLLKIIPFSSLQLNILLHFPPFISREHPVFPSYTPLSTGGLLLDSNFYCFATLSKASRQ